MGRSAPLLRAGLELPGALPACHGERSPRPLHPVPALADLAEQPPSSCPFGRALGTSPGKGLADLAGPCPRQLSSTRSRIPARLEDPGPIRAAHRKTARHGRAPRRAPRGRVDLGLGSHLDQTTSSPRTYWLPRDCLPSRNSQPTPHRRSVQRRRERGRTPLRPRFAHFPCERAAPGVRLPVTPHRHDRNPAVLCET